MFGVGTIITPDGISRLSTKGTPFEQTANREGYSLESSNSGIFVDKPMKETCFNPDGNLKYNLPLGEECMKKDQCQSKNCSGLQIMGFGLPGKCIPFELVNSVGKGGRCYSMNECKGTLYCLDGICKSKKIELDIRDFATLNTDISAERDISKEIFTNPINRLEKTNEVIDPNAATCNTTLDCIKLDKRATCVNKQCTKQYDLCSLKNKKVCSKLGDTESVMNTTDDKSFVKTKQCCIRPDDICVPNNNTAKVNNDNKDKPDGVCASLTSALHFDYEQVSTYNITNGIKCKSHHNCKSGFCNPHTNHCTTLFSRSKGCDSLNPCPISHQCVYSDSNKTESSCELIEKLPKGKGLSGTACAENKKQCKDPQTCSGRKSNIALQSAGIRNILYPIKTVMRVFADTECGFNPFNENDFLYGVCGTDIEGIKQFKKKYDAYKMNIYKKYRNYIAGIKTDSNEDRDGGRVIYRKKRAPSAGPNDVETHPPTRKHIRRPDAPTSKFSSELAKLSGPKLILFNNFCYDDFDRAASFDIFDYTSQNSIIFYEGKYILAKTYFMLRDEFRDDDSVRDKYDYNFDIMCIFVDHLKFTGGKLNEIGKNLKCFYSGSREKFGKVNKYNIFEPFPQEFGLGSGTRDAFNPLTYNIGNILLVPNLFQYEYLVFLLFGERIVCSPYKKFKYDPQTNMVEKDKGYTRGYYQYTIKFESLNEDTISALKKLEIDWGDNLGYHATIDVPFTTFNRASDVKGSSSNYFFGTDALGITADIFDKVFLFWKKKIYPTIEPGNDEIYLKLLPVDSLNLRKFDGQSYLLRYDDTNVFIKEYIKNTNRKTLYNTLVDNLLNGNATIKYRTNSLKDKKMYKLSTSSNNDYSNIPNTSVTFDESNYYSVFNDFLKR